MFPLRLGGQQYKAIHRASVVRQSASLYPAACWFSGLHPARRALRPPRRRLRSLMPLFCIHSLSLSLSLSLHQVESRGLLCISAAGAPQHSGGTGGGGGLGFGSATALFGGWMAHCARRSWSGAKLLPSLLHPPIPPLPCLTLCVSVSRLVHARQKWENRRDYKVWLFYFFLILVPAGGGVGPAGFWADSVARVRIMQVGMLHEAGAERVETGAEWSGGLRGKRKGTGRLGHICSSSKLRPGGERRRRMAWAEARASVSGCRLANLSSTRLNEAAESSAKNKRPHLKPAPTSRLLLC